MKEFTHHLENIFDQIPNPKLDVTPELVDVICQSIDFLEKIKDAIVNDRLEKLDIGPNIEKLKTFINNQPYNQEVKTKKQDINSYKLDQYQKNIVLNGIEFGHNALEISILLEDDTLMKSVWVLLIHNNLKDAGEIVVAFPPIEEMEKEGEFQGDLTFIVLTMQSKQEILHIISQISDIKAVRCTKWPRSRA